VYYLESFFDITKRKIIENELKKSEAKFKQIFENIEDLYYQLDRNGIITLVSPSIYKLSGWSEKDVIGKHVSEIYAFPEKRENLLQVLREKGFVRDYEIILKNKDGSQLNASVSAQIVYNENGEPEGISGLLRDISERKKAEEEIYASREQYMLAVQGSNDGIWDWDIRNNELYLSPKWKEMLGYQDNELENRFETFEGRLHPDDKPFVMNKVQQYFSGEINNYSVEFRLRHRDGHYVWILARGEALRDEEGKAYRMAGSHSDITERKRSEQKLRDSEMNFRTFFNTVEDMIAVAQPDGKIIYSNKHFSEKLGYSFEKLKEMQLLDLHPAEYLDEAKDRYIEIISGISNRCNLPLLTKNEEQIQVETQYWFGKWNGEDCIYAISKDLTRQKAALERFQKLFDSNPAMMALCNLKDRKIIDVNNAFVDKLYYSKDELLGQDFFKTNIISEKAAVDEIIKEFIASKRVINREIQLETKNRTVFQGLLSIESIDSKIEKLILIVLADISVQKKAEYQAQAANRAKSEFLANMSHEIRTPMNSILGFSEILMTEIEEPKYSSYLKAISNSGKTLLTLINDILDLSKIEAGKLELKPELINLRAVLHDIIEIFSFKVQEKKIALSLSIDKSFPDRVALDDIRFRQILLNLVGNAVKFTNEGFVKCELNVDKIDEASIDFSIIISDSGIGIAEDQLDRIFETFSQQSGQDAKLYGGTGLGLAISKRLCELMGAEIRVESQIGIGSAFYVVFKQIAYSKAPFKKESSSVVSQEKYAFGKAKILIADDIKYNRELIISYLAEFGFEFIEAETGKEAIDLALAAQPNLIFMDIRLPDICGINAAKSIKESSSSSNIPIIAFTASVSFGDDTDIYEYFDGILTKPINKSELFEELKRFLNYKRIDNEAYVETENGICDELSLLAPDKRSAVLNEYHTTFASRIDNLLLLMNTEDISLFNEELKEFARRNGLRALEQASYRLELLLNEYEFNEIEELVLEINSNFSDNN
jgi:PAS domain S-box-containing protein